jgi:hypothetical protein
MQRIEDLHVREAVKKYDALDQLVGVFHFLDRFLAPLLCQILVTPIVEQSVMEPVLIDRGQFVPQRSIEKLDDFSVTLHNWLLLWAFMFRPNATLAKNFEMCCPGQRHVPHVDGIGLV